LYLLEMQGKLV